jgi:Tol biopolymer transport system component
MDGLKNHPRNDAPTTSLGRGGRRRPSRVYRPALGVERFEERRLLSAGLVSVGTSGATSGNDASMFVDVNSALPRSSVPGRAALSADGKLLVFESNATDLAAGVNDANGATDVFVKNLASGQTTLVSAVPGGSVGNGRSFDPIISPDGRYVAFLSTATNLASVAGSAPNSAVGSDAGLLYVRDLKAGTTTLIDSTPAGGAADGYARGAFAFSPDGTKLAFADTSTNLLAASASSAAGSTAGSATAPTSVYLRDLAAGTTSLVSATPDGHAADGSSSRPVFSPDGQRLAFLSTATTLTPSTPVSSASQGSLFVRDLSTATTSLVSVTPGGAASAGTVTDMAFSPDGHSLAFIANATDLTSNALDTDPDNLQVLADPSVRQDVFVRNLSTSTTTAVSVTPAGQLSAGNASDLSYTPDGKSVAYLSNAVDLTANPHAAAVTAASAAKAAALAGQTGTSQASAVNLFLTNVSTLASSVASITPDGQLSAGRVGWYAISPDGSQVAFSAAATDLTNNPPVPLPASAANPIPAAPAAGSSDTFVRDLAAQTTTLLSAIGGGLLSSNVNDTGPQAVVFSPDGKTVYFTEGDVLVPGDTNNTSDIYKATAPFAAAGTVQFASWQYSASEFDGKAVITVVRTAPLDAAATVDYTVQDGTARAGSDYQATSGTLSFAAGEASATFVVPLNAPTSFGDIRTATITLSNPTGATLGYPTAVLNLSGVMHTSSPAGGSSSSTPSSTPTATQTPQEALVIALATSKKSTMNYTSDAARVASQIAAANAVVAPTGPGPTVSSVVLQASRRRITGIIIQFSKALTNATAGNPTNYSVHLVGSAGRSKRGLYQASSVGSAVAINRARYDAATHTVTLLLRTPVSTSQSLRLKISGAANGVTDTAGVPLNGQRKGIAGNGAVFTLN